MAAYPCAHTITINGAKKTFANSAEFKKYLSEGGLEELVSGNHISDKYKSGITEKKFTAKGGNKVVDENGEPLVVYHGTSDDFTEFKKDSQSKTKHPSSRLGFFFTTSKRIADMFNRNTDGVGGFTDVSKLPYRKGAKILSSHLSIKNPKILTKSEYQDLMVLPDYSRTTTAEEFEKIKEKYKKEGFDGIKINGDFFNEIGEYSSDQYIAFDKSQIKIISKEDVNGSNKSKETQNVKGVNDTNEQGGIGKEGAQKTKQDTKETSKNIKGLNSGGLGFIADLQSREAKVQNYQRQLDKYEKNPSEETKSKILKLEKDLQYETSYFDLNPPKPKSEQPIKEEKNIPEKKVEGEGEIIMQHIKVAPDKIVGNENPKLGDKVELIDGSKGEVVGVAETTSGKRFGKKTTEKLINVKLENSPKTETKTETVTPKNETVTPPEAPKEIVEPPKKEISEGAKKIADLDAKIADKKKVISEKLKKSRGELGLNKLPIEVIPDLVDLAKLYLEKYGRQFGEFIKGFREEHPEFDDVADSEIKSELFDKVKDEPTDGEVWDSVNKEKLKEIKGAKEFYEKETGTTWTDIHEKAMNNLQSMYPNLDLYDAAKARVSEIASYYGDKNPYNPTDQDIAVMQWLNHATQSKMSEIKGWDSENPIERKSALLQYEDLQKDLDNLVTASHTRQAGTAFGLRGAEMRIDPQYGLKIRRLQYLKAKNGEPLTEGELQETAANWQKEKAILKKEHELKEKAMQEKFDKEIEQLHKEYQQKLKTVTPKTKKEKTLSQTGDDIANYIRKIKMPSGAKIDFTLGTWDLAVEGVARLVKAGLTVADAIKKLIDEGTIKFKNVKDHTDFEDALSGGIDRQQVRNDALNKMKEVGANSITKEMVAKNLIKDYVNSHIGEVEPQDILQTAYDNLKEVLPDITQDQVRDAYLKKGDYKLPTKKKVLSDIEQTKQTLNKIAKIESDLADLKNKGDLQKKNGEYSKKEKTDKLVEAKQNELKQALIDRGMKIASEDKYTKASYDSRAKSHNARVDGLQKEVETLLQNEDLTKAQRTGLLKLNAQLDTAKIKLNPDSKFSQEQVINTGLSRVTNIEKEFRDLSDTANFEGKDKVELKLQQLIDKFNKDKNESEQDIKLQREKDRLKRENQENQRKLNAMEFSDEVPTPLTKSDTELIKLQIEKNQIEAETRRRIKNIEEKNKPFKQKVLETTRAIYVASLIYKFGTAAKVAATSLIRPNLEAITKMTFGNIFKYISPSIAEAAKRGGESSSWRSVKKSYEAYFRQVGEEGMKKIYQKANDKFEKLAKEYNDFEKKVFELKKDKGEDSVEYKNAEKQLTQLKNAKDDALLSSVGNAMYQVIGGSSLKDALDALVSRSNKIERQFGFLDKESIKDGGKLDKFNYLLGFIGRSHSALKTFSARANYAAGFIARLEAARIDGRNISSPEVLMEIAYDSYIDWDRGKYQQSNFVTDVFNSINNHLENQYKGTTWDKYAKGLATMLKFDVAITRVPVNILHEAVMEYTLGAFKAMYYGGKEYNTAYKELKKGGILPSDENFKPLLKEQISKMDKDQAAMVARCFRKGGFGLGLFALFAITGAISFGGFHRKRSKETDELKVGEIAVGDNSIGELMSKIIEHQPSMMPTLMGMDFAKMYHDKVVRGESTPEAAMDAMMSTLEFLQDQVPQTKIVNPIVITKQVFSGMSRQLGLGSSKGYTNEQLKSSTFQYLDDKNIPMSEPMQGNLTDNEFKEFLNSRNDKVKSMWQDAITNGARINDSGDPTSDITVSKRKPIKDLSYDGHKKLMESIERSATDKSKEELATKNIKSFVPKIGETYGKYKVIKGNGVNYDIENVATFEIIKGKSKQFLINAKYGTDAKTSSSTLKIYTP